MSKFDSLILRKSKRALWIFYVAFAFGVLTKFSQAQSITDNALTLVESTQQQPGDDPYREIAAPFSNGTLTYFYRRSYHKIVVVSRRYSGGSIQFKSFVVGWPETEYNDEVREVEQSSQGLISLKYGSTDGTLGEYKVFLLDPAKKSISKVIPQRSIMGYKNYKDYIWSPDGGYIAYLMGGNLVGQPTFEGEKIELWVYDVQKRTSQLVTTKAGLAESFTWGAPHKLFYAAPPSVAGASKQAKATKPPALFQYDLSTKQTKLLFQDCYRPILSRDGQRVAFFGQASLAHQLCVADIDGTHRQSFAAEKRSYPQIFWSEDKHSLISARTTVPGPEAQMTFTVWDLKTRQLKREVKLTVTDPNRPKDFPEEPIDRPEIFPRFVILGPSGDTYLVSCLQLLGVAEQFLVTKTCFQSIDLLTGKTKVLATAQANNDAVPLWLSGLE